MTTTPVRQREDYAEAPAHDAYDAASTSGTWIRVLAYGAVGALLTLAGWFVLHSISLAAFNTSYVTRALAVGAAFVALILAGLAGWMWWRGRRNLLWEAVLSLAPAVLVLSLIGVPLAATRLYLDGIQVDQGFRTQFLSRMAESVTHGDMNYVDLPSFYPLGWFWLGGRLANVLGMPGWEVYQPWALVSLAAAASMLTPIWHRLTGSLPAAAGIALITTSVVLAEVAVEPYAAVVGMFLPAAAVGARRALAGSWPATIAVMVYLGLSATFYTLYTAVGALTVVVLALIVCLTERRWWDTIKHLLVIGFGSIAIALISWGPYLRKLLSGEFDAHSTANHFLPEEGTYIPLPFFELSIVGLLSLIGLIYLLVRSRSTTALSLGVAALVCYFWVVLSMAFALLGTSLLGFRIEVLLMLIFATAGVLGIAAAVEEGGHRLYPERWSARAKSTATVVAGVLVCAGTLAYAQQIPEENQEYIDQAYADTDGYGERADRFPADAARYYADVVAFLEEHGRRPNEAVIYTDEINFMAFNPYYGFNAFTSHYANPLGEFDRRNEELVSWAELSHSDPEALTQAIDASPWRGPEAFIFRGDIENGTESGTESATESGAELKTHVAHDIFPSQPNVRYEGLFFNSEAFGEADWAMEQIGPFVVVVRK